MLWLLQQIGPGYSLPPTRESSGVVLIGLAVQHTLELVRGNPAISRFKAATEMRIFK